MPILKITPLLNGLKMDTPAHALSPGFSPGLNAMWVVDGLVRRIEGQTKYSSTQVAGYPMMIGEYKTEGGNSYLLVVTTQKTYKLDTTTMALESIQDGTDFTGDLDIIITGATFFDSAGSQIFVFGNITDATRKWDGSSPTIATLGGSPPKAKTWNVYRNYLFAGNIYHDRGSGADDYPRDAQWCAIGNGESWPADNYLSFRSTPDFLVALANLGPRQVVYKERSISFIDYTGGTIPFMADENVFEGTGPVNPHAIINLKKYHFFLGTDMVFYAFNGMELEPISTNISPILDNLNPNARTRVVSCHIASIEKMIWFVPYSGNEDNLLMLAWDYKHNSWFYKDLPVGVCAAGAWLETASYTWDTLPYSTWEEWSGTWDDISLLSNTPITLLGTKDQYVKKFPIGINDDGQSISSHIKYPWENIDGDDETLKLITKLIIEVLNENVSDSNPETILEIYVDHDDDTPVALNEDGDTYIEIDISDLSANKSYGYEEVHVAVMGYSFMFRLRNATHSWAARVVEIHYETIGMRRVA